MADQGGFDCMVTLTVRADKPQPKKRLRKRISDEVTHRYLGNSSHGVAESNVPKEVQEEDHHGPDLGENNLG